MANCQLARFSPVPPGGFRLYLKDITGQPLYVTVGGKKVDKLRDYDSEALTVQGVAFRKSNNLPGANREEVIAAIAHDTCIDLGCDPRFCSDGSSPVYVNTTPSRGCGGCGRSGRR
jgi:hypothetical protein